MKSKENTDFGKITFLEFFRLTHQKLFWNFRFLVSSASILKKKRFFGFFHGLCLFAGRQLYSALNQKCSEMFITESVMTRGVKIKVGWFSSEHRWKCKSLWISAENDWISMRAQPGYSLETTSNDTSKFSSSLVEVRDLPFRFIWS